MVIGFLIFVGAVGALMAVRRRRKATLAGLNSERPAFTVAPPTRRMNARKHEAL